MTVEWVTLRELEETRSEFHTMLWDLREELMEQINEACRCPKELLEHVPNRGQAFQQQKDGLI